MIWSDESLPAEYYGKILSTTVVSITLSTMPSTIVCCPDILEEEYSVYWSGTGQLRLLHVVLIEQSQCY